MSARKTPFARRPCAVGRTGEPLSLVSAPIAFLAAIIAYRQARYNTFAKIREKARKLRPSAALPFPENGQKKKEPQMAPSSPLSGYYFL